MYDLIISNGTIVDGTGAPAYAGDVAVRDGVIVAVRRRGSDGGGLGHRAIDGEPVPGTFAAEDELFGIGTAMAAGGRAVFELAPMGAGGEDLVAPKKELDWMCRLAESIGMPVSYALLQVDAAPDLWREMMDESLAATAAGAPVFPQVAGRPFGMMIGLQTHHAFSKRPTFRALAARLPHADLVAALREPATRAAILAEADLPPTPGVLFDSMNLIMQHSLPKLYVMGTPPDYEPTSDRTVAAIARAAGRPPLEVLYDELLADDGTHLLMLPVFDYSAANLDAVREMLLHPGGVSGLGDGGAHCGMICDSSIPTFLLTHWVRDRRRGDRLPLEWVIKKQTSDTAALCGLGDRGVVAEGKRADLNLIDLERLTLEPARVAYDLPAGGRRILQGSSGYVATIVNGVTIRRHGQDTGARPGRRVRGAR
jgi:N-acyl-D-amino-acid deacylase